MKKKKDPVYFHADPSEIARIKAIADRDEISYSEAYRRAVSEYNERHSVEDDIHSLTKKVLSKDDGLRDLLKETLRNREAVEREEKSVRPQ